jgi:hypothetical protein
MGITPALVLATLERQLQERRPGFADKHLRDLFSVCSGTSTGAIITGKVAASRPRCLCGYQRTKWVLRESPNQSLTGFHLDRRGESEFRSLRLQAALE